MMRNRDKHGCIAIEDGEDNGWADVGMFLCVVEQKSHLDPKHEGHFELGGLSAQEKEIPRLPECLCVFVPSVLATVPPIKARQCI